MQVYSLLSAFLLAKCALAEHAIEGNAEAEEICPLGRCPMRSTHVPRTTITIYCTRTVTTTTTSTVCVTQTNTRTITSATTITTCPTPTSSTTSGCPAPTSSSYDMRSDSESGANAVDSETEGEQRPGRRRVCVRRIRGICTRWRWVSRRRTTDRSRFPRRRTSFGRGHFN